MCQNNDQYTLPQPDAPVLEFCTNTATAALFRIKSRSDWNEPALTYRMKYDRTDAEHSRQKIIEWTGAELEKTGGRQLITGLRPNTEYVVSAKCQAENSGIWSKRSEEIVFQTKTKAGMIIQHWFRTLRSNSIVSFGFLMAEVLKYHSDQSFKWDSSRVRDRCITDFAFSADGQKVTHQRGRVLSSICAKNIISEKLGSIVRWEMSLKYPKHCCLFTMGYIPVEHIGSIYIDNGSRIQPSINIIDNHQHVEGIRIGDGDITRRYIGHKIIEIAQNGEEVVEPMFKVDDRMELRFDFTSRVCTGYFNGEFKCVVSTTLPKEMYLVSCVLATGAVRETTLFECSEFAEK